MAQSPFAAAPPDKLDEIIRLAEVRLAAQLTVGIAADQRAMNMASIFSALTAALIGWLVAIKDKAPQADIVPIALLIIGFALAAVLAGWSARPVPWDMVGNEPGEWAQDIIDGDSLHNGKAAMAKFYDEMIKANDQQMTVNSRFLGLAFASVGVALFVSALGALIL